MNTVSTNLLWFMAALLLVAGNRGKAQALPGVPLASTNANGPHIQFATPAYDFGKVSAGELVKHAYVFTNTGNQVLEISDARPSCGCTTAGNWERRVEPGKTGSIPIQFNSANFTGPVHKTITVTCNDPRQPVTMLQLQGTVWKAIDVTPAYAIFNVTAGATQSNETRVVRIVNNTEDSLELQSPQCANHAFKAELKTIRPGKEFQVQIHTVPPLSYGTIQAPITIKTSSTNMPVITINTIAMVQQPIMVMPSQIMLPAGPLGPNTRMGVTVRNNGATNIVVSDPKVSVPGVQTTVQQIQAGRIFNVMLSFTNGFQLPPGQRAELTLKTSDPQFAQLKVPIFQVARSYVRPPYNPARPIVRPPVRPVTPMPVRPANSAIQPVRPLFSTNHVTRAVTPPLPPAR